MYGSIRVFKNRLRVTSSVSITLLTIFAMVVISFCRSWIKTVQQSSRYSLNLSFECYVAQITRVNEIFSLSQSCWRANCALKRRSYCVIGWLTPTPSITRVYRSMTLQCGLMKLLLIQAVRTHVLRQFPTAFHKPIGTGTGYFEKSLVQLEYVAVKYALYRFNEVYAPDIWHAYCILASISLPTHKSPSSWNQILSEDFRSYPED